MWFSLPQVAKESDGYSAGKELGTVFRDLSSRKEVVVEEGDVMIDHVHMVLSVLSTYSLDQVMGFIKEKPVIVFDSVSSFDQLLDLK